MEGLVDGAGDQERRDEESVGEGTGSDEVESTRGASDLEEGVDRGGVNGNGGADGLDGLVGTKGAIHAADGALDSSSDEANRSVG